MLLLVFSIRSYHINHHFSIFYLTKQIAVIIIDKDGNCLLYTSDAADE